MVPAARLTAFDEGQRRMTAGSAQRVSPVTEAAPFGIRSISIDSRALCFDGQSFGAVGPYEILHGSIVADLDPAHPLNAGH